jgi:hypothetical protein
MFRGGSSLFGPQLHCRPIARSKGKEARHKRICLWSRFLYHRTVEKSISVSVLSVIIPAFSKVERKFTGMFQASSSAIGIGLGIPVFAAANTLSSTYPF